LFSCVVVIVIIFRILGVNFGRNTRTLLTIKIIRLKKKKRGELRANKMSAREVSAREMSARKKSASKLKTLLFLFICKLAFLSLLSFALALLAL
jgi:hypothetical protein